MPRQINLHARLADLFADLEPEATPHPTDQDTLTGWTWECDALGKYTACSPEVEAVLGVKPAAFLEKPLASFQLTRQSGGRLAAILQTGDFPAKVTLLFKANDGSRVNVRAHIYRLQAGEAEAATDGWRGFNQVIETGRGQSIPAATPTAQTTIPESTTTTAPPLPLASTHPYGIAVETGQDAFPVSMPYTNAGELSLQERQTFAYPASADAPAALAVPVDVQEHSLGLLEIIDDSPNRSWSENDQRLVEQVADQLSLALENARLFQNTQAALARTEALFQVGQSAIAFESLTKLLQSVADTIAGVLPAERTLVAVLNLDKKELTHFFESNAPPIPIQEDTFQQLMDGLTGWCVRERKPLLSLKEGIDPRESEKARLIRKATDAGSLVVVPMLYQNNVFGTLTAINTFTLNMRVKLSSIVFHQTNTRENQIIGTPLVRSNHF